MKYFIISFVFFLFLSKLPLPAQRVGAQALNGSQIAQRSFSLQKPASLRMKVMLRLISPQNAVPRVRHIKVVQQEIPKSRRFIEFTSPQDVAGTKFLSYERGTATETRMFSPGDGKLRVIASSSKKNSFMGTDLSYYDLERHEHRDFNFTLRGISQQIKDKSFVKNYFYVVEAVPKDSEAPYGKMLYWIDEETFQARRIEAFANDIKVKDIYVLQNLAGTEYFIPKLMLAINYRKSGHRTVWLVQEQEIDAAIEERVFSRQNLK